MQWGVTYPDPYMDLYNASAHAIKAVSPLLEIGGPATMQTQHLVDFVNRARSIGAPVDFVSAHLYPTDANCSHANATIDCFAETVRHAAAMVAEASAPPNSSVSTGNTAPLPFYLTEYNVGLGVPAADANGAAAFVIRNAFMLDGALEVFSYWCFSDIFEEM